MIDDIKKLAHILRYPPTKHKKYVCSKCGDNWWGRSNAARCCNKGGAPTTEELGSLKFIYKYKCVRCRNWYLEFESAVKCCEEKP